MCKPLAFAQGRLSLLQVDGELVGAVAAAAVAGSLVGTRLARAIDPVKLRRGSAGFVLLMGSSIFVREGTLVAATASAALPANLPQLVFAVVVLGVGVAVGRATRTVGNPMSERAFDHGDGI